MTLAQLVDRYGRAIALVVALAAGAGIVAGVALPSSIYPRSNSRVSSSSRHSGTLPAQTMMLTVTRPLEQAVMEVPGIRRVRSTTFRGAAEISAQFEPATDMVVALQQVQERSTRRARTLPAGHRSRRRAAHARRVSRCYILNLTGAAARPPTCTTTPSTSCARRWRACPAPARSRSRRATRARSKS